MSIIYSDDWVYQKDKVRTTYDKLIIQCPPESPNLSVVYEELCIFLQGITITDELTFLLPLREDELVLFMNQVLLPCIQTMSVKRLFIVFVNEDDSTAPLPRTIHSFAKDIVSRCTGVMMMKSRPLSFHFKTSNDTIVMITSSLFI